MNEPLTKSQKKLRGRSIGEMSIEQLRDWIDACTKMTNWVGAKKAWRDWRLGREAASAELVRRGDSR